MKFEILFFQLVIFYFIPRPRHFAWTKSQVFVSIALRYKNINYFKCRKTFEISISEKKKLQRALIFLHQLQKAKNPHKRENISSPICFVHFRLWNKATFVIYARMLKQEGALFERICKNKAFFSEQKSVCGIQRLRVRIHTHTLERNFKSDFPSALLARWRHGQQVPATCCEHSVPEPRVRHEHTTEPSQWDFLPGWCAQKWWKFLRRPALFVEI